MSPPYIRKPNKAQAATERVLAVMRKSPGVEVEAYDVATKAGITIKRAGMALVQLYSEGRLERGADQPNGRRSKKYRLPAESQEERQTA